MGIILWRKDVKLTTAYTNGSFKGFMIRFMMSLFMSVINQVFTFILTSLYYLIARYEKSPTYTIRHYNSFVRLFLVIGTNVIIMPLANSLIYEFKIDNLDQMRIDFYFVVSVYFCFAWLYQLCPPNDIYKSLMRMTYPL